MARVHGHASTTAVVEAEPSLVLVDGVWVVEDYNEPVFYDEGYYWRFYGGVWYRSNVHTGNWIRIDVVPGRVRAIDRPTRFVRFHAAANMQKRRGPPRGNDGPTRDMDRRGDGGPAIDQPGHDAKGDMKAEKAEEKADAKAEKADAKAEKGDAKADAKAAKEAEKAAAKEAKEKEKADKAAAKAAEKEAKEKAKADAKAAKDAEKAAGKEGKEKEGGGGGKKGKKDQP
ncbi:MAG TPA: hypothetical protein VIG06_29100 [Kofleriaceae bacterium]